MLSTAAPEAFGFLNENPAGITLRESSLVVPPGETLSIVGGNIEIRGGRESTLTFDEQGEPTSVPSLGAPGSCINLASVASRGEVIPSPPGQDPDLNVHAFARLGLITISAE